MAGGGELMVSTDAGAMLMLSGPETVCTGVPESVALTVRFDVPASVGVPLTMQPFKVRPAGRVPAVNVQAYGEVPPVTPMFAL